MDPRITSLLDGPVGTIVQIAALVSLGAVVLWVITGIRVIGDDDRDARRSGPIRRLILGAAAAFVLIAMALNPSGVLEWAHEWIAGLVERFTD